MSCYVSISFGETDDALYTWPNGCGSHVLPLLQSNLTCRIKVYRFQQDNSVHASCYTGDKEQERFHNDMMYVYIITHHTWLQVQQHGHSIWVRTSFAVVVRITLSPFKLPCLCNGAGCCFLGHRGDSNNFMRAIKRHWSWHGHEHTAPESLQTCATIKTEMMLGWTLTFKGITAVIFLLFFGFVNCLSAIGPLLQVGKNHCLKSSILEVMANST